MTPVARIELVSLGKQKDQGEKSDEQEREVGLGVEAGILDGACSDLVMCLPCPTVAY